MVCGRLLTEPRPGSGDTFVAADFEESCFTGTVGSEDFEPKGDDVDRLNSVAADALVVPHDLGECDLCSIVSRPDQAIVAHGFGLRAFDLSIGDMV